MKTNPILHKLGLSANDRVIIFHADDIGSCQSSVAAYADLLDFGLLSSAATMVPCPWFPAAAELCRAHGGDLHLDMGVHLTLNSEWTTYRWGPISTRASDSGLLDADGYFPSLSDAVYPQARLQAVERELRAQIERALATGIDATHIDSHMLTLFHTRFLRLYCQLGLDYRLPPLLLRPEVEQRLRWSYDDLTEPATTVLLHEMEEQGFAFFDYVYVFSLQHHEDRLAEGRRLLAEAPPGLTGVFLHPCHDTPELRAMTPDWRCRVADYKLFCDETWRRTVEQSGVKVIGYRALRDLMREA